MIYTYRIEDGGCGTKLLILLDENNNELDRHNMGKVYKHFKSLQQMARETAAMLIREIELRKIWNRR